MIDRQFVMYTLSRIYARVSKQPTYRHLINQLLRAIWMMLPMLHQRRGGIPIAWLRHGEQADERRERLEAVLGCEASFGEGCDIGTQRIVVVVVHITVIRVLLQHNSESLVW
jgi:hypothetical protein